MAETGAWLLSTKVIGSQNLPESGPVQSAVMAQGVVQMLCTHQSLAQSPSAAHEEPSACEPSKYLGMQVITQPSAVAICVGHGLHDSLIAQSPLERQWSRQVPVQVPPPQSLEPLHDEPSEHSPSHRPLSQFQFSVQESPAAVEVVGSEKKQKS